MYRIALFVVFLVGLHTGVGDAEIRVTNDSSTSSTTIASTHRMTLDNQINLRAEYKKADGSLIENFALVLTITSKDWQYPDCQTINWLLDGQPLELMFADREGHVVSYNFVTEVITLKGSMPQLRQLAAAKTIDYHMCGDEYSASLEDLENIRSFLTAVEEHRK